MSHIHKSREDSITAPPYTITPLQRLSMNDQYRSIHAPITLPNGLVRSKFPTSYYFICKYFNKYMDELRSLKKDNQNTIMNLKNNISLISSNNQQAFKFLQIVSAGFSNWYPNKVAGMSLTFLLTHRLPTLFF